MFIWFYTVVEAIQEENAAQEKAYREARAKARRK